MADTLIRESVVYSAQPLCPVPQYWNGASYEKVQGSSGATFTEIITSAGGTPRFSGSNPGCVQLTATSTVKLSGTSTVTLSATVTVEVVTSAGASASFSGANPASVKLTSTSTVNFSGSGTVAISGTATVNFSGSGTVAISGTATVGFSGSQTVTISGTSTVSISGTSTVAISGNVTALNQVVGAHTNAWSAAATISAGATSNSIDLQYCYQISYFGTVTNTASLTLMLRVSQDNINFYTAESKTITAGTTSDFHYSTTSAARYARLMTGGVSAVITATIAGK